MFGIGAPELMIIIVVALIVLGPKKLPEMMKSVGRGLAEFKRVGNDVKSTLDNEIERADQEIRKKEADEALAKRQAAATEAEAEAKAGASDDKPADAETAATDEKPADKESA